MAQSHIKITGGLLDGKSMRNTITVAGHTFEAGQALRFNRGAGTGVCGDFYAPAIADSAANSEVIGVVESVEGSSFVLVYGGEIATANFDGKYALNDDDVFFLSGTTHGLVDKIPPSTAGQVIKPVLVRTDGTKAIVTNFIGTVIGGSSVVNLDGIQPVGTIEPYAGQANDVPATWSLCDGGALSTTAFIDLYNRIGREFGFHQTIQSSAITSGAGIAVGQVVQQSGGLTGRIVSIDFALNQITVDVDYLKSTTDVALGSFIPHGERFGTSNLKIPSEADISSTQGTIYGGSITPSTAQPPATITLATTTDPPVTAFRKPDLRGKVVMGSASETEGTVIALDRNSPRGSILGEYEHQLTVGELPSHSHEVKETDSDRQYGQVNSSSDPNSPFSINNTSGGGYKGRQVQSDTVGSNQPVNNLQPTVAINWIIKTTANAAAAVIDNLTTQIPLTDLTDVSITPADGDIVMYDASNTPVKFKAYNLLTNYKPNAENIFQIDTSGSNPKVKFGGPGIDSANGFSVNLDGLGSGAPKFEVLDTNNTPLMSLQKTTTTDTTYGIASIGTNGPPQESANLSLGSKGLLFTNSSSTPVNKIVTNINSVGSDENLVTEKAVRDAIDFQQGFTYRMTDHGSGNTDNYRKEIFPSWVSTRTNGTGSTTYTGTGISVRHKAGDAVNELYISNGTGSDIIATVAFGGMINRDGSGANINYDVVGSAYEILVKNGSGIGSEDEVKVNGIVTNGQTFAIWSHHSDISFRKANADESTAGFGHAHPDYTTG